MNLTKCCLVFLLSLSIFGCAPGGGSKTNKAPLPKMGPFGSCIPEADLMANNIVRGEVVKSADQDAKAVAALLVGNSICTTAAIADDVLLTAAHCVETEDAATTLAVFHHSISCESGYSPEKHSVKVRKVVRHKGYDFKKEVPERRDDVALIFLEGKVPAGTPIYKIADPASINDDNQLFLYGYGKTSGKSGGSGILRRAVVDRKNYTFDLEHKLAAIDQKVGSGICRGDSGGPTLVKIGGEFQILGVNSFVMGEKEGNICSLAGFQALAYSYVDWISLEIRAYRAEFAPR